MSDAVDGDAAPAPEPAQVSREDVQEYARYLGIDLEREPHLVQIAEEALTAALPDGWEEVDNGEHIFFHHAESKHSQYEHPLEEQYRMIITAYRDSYARHRPRHVPIFAVAAAPAGEGEGDSLRAAAAAGRRVAYRIEPSEEHEVLVHLIPAPAADERSSAGAGAQGTIRNALGVCASPARRAAEPAPTARAAPPAVVVARTAARRKQILERRRGTWLRRTPPPLLASSERLCSGQLLCELRLLQQTLGAQGKVPLLPLHDVRARLLERAAVAERSARAAAPGAAEPRARSSALRDRLLFAVLDGLARARAPEAARTLVAADARGGEEAGPPGADASEEEARLAAWQAASMPAWAAAELQALRDLEQTELLPPELGGGFCARAPVDIVRDVVYSLRSKMADGEV